MMGSIALFILIRELTGMPFDQTILLSEVENQGVVYVKLCFVQILTMCFSAPCWTAFGRKLGIATVFLGTSTTFLGIATQLFRDS